MSSIEVNPIPKLYEVFQTSFDIGAAVNPNTIVQARDLIATYVPSWFFLERH
jgi:endo-1,4-beta-xylanase